MRPVVISPELIEGHITENRMAMLIIDHRDVARDTVIRGFDAGCRRPVHSTVDRIGDMRIVLISCDHLSRVARIFYGTVHQHQTARTAAGGRTLYKQCAYPLFGRRWKSRV